MAGWHTAWHSGWWFFIRNHLQSSHFSLHSFKKSSHLLQLNWHPLLWTPALFILAVLHLTVIIYCVKISISSFHISVTACYSELNTSKFWVCLESLPAIPTPALWFQKILGRHLCLDSSRCEPLLLWNWLSTWIISPSSTCYSYPAVWKSCLLSLVSK